MMETLNTIAAWSIAILVFAVVLGLLVLSVLWVLEAAAYSAIQFIRELRPDAEKAWDREESEVDE